MKAAEHRPSRRSAAQGTSATNSNKCRLHELRSASGLSQESTSRFLDFRPHAAIIRESAISNASANWPLQSLDYDHPTPLHFNAKGGVPLPYGHTLVENCADGMPQVNIGTAAVIPSEWPLQIAPSQFQLRDAHGARLNVTRTYEVSDVCRETTVATLLADVRGFLKLAFRSRLSPAAVDALQLIAARREKSAYVPLSPSSTAASDE